MVHKKPEIFMLFQTIIYSVRLCARLAVSRLIILDVVYYPGTAVPHVCECDEHMVESGFRHRLETEDRRYRWPLLSRS